MREAEVQTEVATTAHGDVEYEVVECTSCGNEVAKEDAKRVVVGTIKSITHWGALGKREYNFDTADYQEGWACQYCENGDLVSLPTRRLSDPPVVKAILILGAIAFFLGMLLGGVIA